MKRMRQPRYRLYHVGEQTDNVQDVFLWITGMNLCATQSAGFLPLGIRDNPRLKKSHSFIQNAGEVGGTITGSIKFQTINTLIGGRVLKNDAEAAYEGGFSSRSQTRTTTKASPQ